MSAHGFSTELSIQLSSKTRVRLRKEWEKAIDRTLGDPEGAITAARTFLESVCKHILDETHTVYQGGMDLPKLYDLSSQTLGISSKSDVSEINKSIFRSVYNIVRSVGEMRNKAGDAHGKSFHSVGPSSAQARLAVSLSGSVAHFMIGALDNHLTAAHRLTPEGDAVLIFDKSLVWRLLDHARNSPEHLESYGEKSPAALWLVGDSGIYLMSNGSPPQLQDGSIKNAKVAGSSHRLTAYAEGCDPGSNIDHWWPIHNAIDEGNDFVRTIPIEHFDDRIAHAEKSLVIVAGPNGEAIYTDHEWQSHVAV